jgi:hypothetical protein
VPRRVRPETCDPLEPQEQEHDEERLRRRLDRHAAELEQPRGEPGEDDHDNRDERASGEAEGEDAEQQHGREHEDGRHPRATL